MQAETRQIVVYLLLILSFAGFLYGLIGPFSGAIALPLWLSISLFYLLPILLGLAVLKVAKRPVEKVAAIGITGLILIVGGGLISMQLF